MTMETEARRDASASLPVSNRDTVSLYEKGWRYIELVLALLMELQ